MKRFLHILPYLLLPLLFFLGVTVGSFYISPEKIWIDGSLDPIAGLRIVRMCAAMVIGSSLALSGMIFQAVLRNPLAEPFILGVSGGAGTGAALVIVCGWGASFVLSVPLGALTGALVALSVALFVSRGGRRGSETLLLSGVIIGTVSGSILMYLISIARVDELAGITWWMLGDLQTADSVLLIPGGLVLLILTPLLFLFSREINALSIGDSEAWNFGVSTVKMRLFLILSASLLASFSVAIAGIIGFCGLIVPHIVRRIYGCDHRKITWMVFVWGADFLMMCDILTRIFSEQKEIPIGVITSLIGGPFFLWIINRRRSHEI
ncbi:MAG: iron ABC transporter permease [Lentisphaeria bacterium]|nr:iron ABC transporter permease [Lentisphaeria bacterium]